MQMSSCSDTVNTLFVLCPHLVPLMTIFWILASLSVIVTISPLPIPEKFKAAVRASAARGKLWTDRPKDLGRFSDLHVPQRWFLHFYAIGFISAVAALSALLVSFPIYFPSSTFPSTSSSVFPTFSSLLAAAFPTRLLPFFSIPLSSSPPPPPLPLLALPLFLFLAHATRRLIESKWVFHYPQGTHMHVLAYVFSFAYYVVTPLSLVPSGVFSPSVARQFVGRVVCPFLASTTSPFLPPSSSPLPLPFSSYILSIKNCCDGLAASVPFPSPSSSPPLTSLPSTPLPSSSPPSPTASFPFTLVPSSLDWIRLSPQMDTRSLRDWQLALISGVVIFSLGFLLQLVSHIQFGRLSRRATASRVSRESSSPSSPSPSSLSGAMLVFSGGTPYALPSGGCFRLVSCPHYLGEIVIYVGFFLTCLAVEKLVAADSSSKTQSPLSSSSSPVFWILDPNGWVNPRPFLALIWVVVNLALAAEATQKWYRSAFGDQYPKSRKALIPGIF